MSDEIETQSLKIFSKESLIEHVKSNPNNTFISIHENVYDVTTFLDEVIFYLLIFSYFNFKKYDVTRYLKPTCFEKSVLAYNFSNNRIIICSSKLEKNLN